MKALFALIGCLLYLTSFSSDTIPVRKEHLYRCLDMEKEAGFSVHEENYRLLDTILFLAEKRIDPRDTSASDYPVNILRSIHTILDEVGIKEDYNQENNYKSLLSYSLQTKKFDCDKFSFVFLAVAERINLPLHAVLLPSHMAIEWNDSTRFFYWETTAQSKRTREEYIKQFELQKHHLYKEMYLKPLTPEELQLCFLYNRGLTFLLLKKYEKAQKDIDSAKALKGIFPFVRFMKDFCAQRIIIQKTSAILSYDPQNDSARIDRAKSLIQLNGEKNFKIAITDLDYVLAVNPDHTEAHFWRGVAYLRLFTLRRLSTSKNSFKKALEDFDFVHAYSPFWYDAMMYKSILFRWARNYEEAMQEINNALSYRISDTAYIEKGNIYYNQKYYHEAIEYYDKALEINSQNVSALLWRGFAHLELEDKKEEALNDLFEAYYQGVMPYPYFKKYAALK